MSRPGTPPVKRNLVKISTTKLRHTSSFLLENSDIKKSEFTNKKDEVCLRFVVEIFTKFLFTGGVPGLDILKKSLLND